MKSNSQSTPTLAELQRFLDRLLSASETDPDSPRLHETAHADAVELGIVPAEAGPAPLQSIGATELIERTRDCIRLRQPIRSADQAMETMSAPPAMPEATP